MDDQFKRLVTVFGVPNRPDPKAFLDEFVAAVGSTWPEGVLERAVTRLISEHGEPYWPMPAKLKDLCRAECPRPQIANGPHDDRPAQTDAQIAEQERTMREHRARMVAMKLEEDAEFTRLGDVSRKAFEDMQLMSQQTHLHRRPE